MEPAELTPVPLHLVDFAFAVGHAGVDPLVLYGPLEEAFAAFASDDAVVEAGCPILANHAGQLLFHSLFGCGLGRFTRTAGSTLILL